jgi:ATP-dependent Clp protease, protease subunit
MAIDVEELNERTIYLQDVDAVSSLQIIEAIEKLNKEDLENTKLYTTNFKLKPIKMVISSFGGSVYDGLAIIAAMKQSVTPIHTYAFGMIMSMALPIFSYGDKRFSDELCTFMYHDVSSGVFGKIADMEIDIKEGKRLRLLINDILVKNTKLKKSDFQRPIKEKEDWYFDSKFALEKNICDEVI